MEIPFFNYKFLYEEHQSETDKILKKVLNKGAFILQEELKEFERSIAEFTKSKYAIGVGNGTDSLILMLKACEISEGDEVIMASHTFVATAGAVNWFGAVPVLVDCGDDHLISVDSIEEMITPRTKVIMPTQLNGRTCDMEKLQTVADKYNLLILEDAAQALGSKFKGKCAGTFGKAGSISLYPAKLLGCFGDGGIILTDDEDFYNRIARLRDHGRDPNSGEIKTWGINSRLDNLQAAVLVEKLKHYPAAIKRRREIAKQYNDRLSEIKELTLPLAPEENSNHFDVYQNYEIEALRRDDLQKYLKDFGIGTLVQWGGKALHQINPINQSMIFDKSKLSRTELLFERCLMLPMNTSLKSDEISYICEKIINFYK